MLADRSVTASRVLEADLLIRGIGLRRAMRTLEMAEPELASFVMETAARLFADLDKACASHTRAKAIHQSAVFLTLTCVEAVRRSV